MLEVVVLLLIFCLQGDRRFKKKKAVSCALTAVVLKVALIDESA